MQYTDDMLRLDAQPEPLLNPKKKVFETVQPVRIFCVVRHCARMLICAFFQGFITLDTLEAAWVDPETKSVHKIRTKDGVCAVQKYKGASLS